MPYSTLILPGVHGSGPDHWQTWFESQLKTTRRVSGIDWETPVLDIWVEAVHRAIKQVSEPVWLVAHSFGCLVTVAASVGLVERIAGAMLVAPADPDRFSSTGLRQCDDFSMKNSSLGAQLPKMPLGFPSIIIASSNDPWMSVRKVTCWAECWGSRFMSVGQAGHINVESGFGPWPEGLALLKSLQSIEK